MNSFPSIILAAVGQPLFGSQWLALLAVLAFVAILLMLVAALGRWLAATHPDSEKASRQPAPAAIPVAGNSPPPEVLAAIAAAVAATVGPKARVASINAVPPHPANLESLMVQWSLEGRRQIYSSHKVR